MAAPTVGIIPVFGVIFIAPTCRSFVLSDAKIQDTFEIKRFVHQQHRQGHFLVHVYSLAKERRVFSGN